MVQSLPSRSKSKEATVRPLKLEPSFCQLKSPLVSRSQRNQCPLSVFSFRCFQHSMFSEYGVFRIRCFQHCQSCLFNCRFSELEVRCQEVLLQRCLRQVCEQWSLLAGFLGGNVCSVLLSRSFVCRFSVCDFSPRL